LSRNDVYDRVELVKTTEGVIMSSEPKMAYHISDIITVALDRMVSNRGMDGVYDILGYMAGADLFTHHLPEVGRQAEIALKAEHPFLKEIEVPEIHSEAEAQAFVAEMGQKYGEYHVVTPMESAYIPTFAEAVELAKSRAGGER
jgi:hypothetical protein